MKKNIIFMSFLMFMSCKKELTIEMYNCNNLDGRPEYMFFKNEKDAVNSDLEAILSQYNADEATYKNVVDSLPIDENLKYQSGFNLFKHKIPMWIFLIALIGLTIWAFRQNLSLIPLLGLISCLYMMAELSVWNWIYFTCWLLIGLVIYFGFSRKNSKLNRSDAP